MTKIFLVCSLLIIRPVFSITCGNEYDQFESKIPVVNGKLSLDNLLFHSKSYFPYWFHGPNKDALNRRYQMAHKINALINEKDKPFEITWSRLEKAFNANVNFKVLSDFAWEELRAGDKELAVQLMEALYAKYPNEYNIVANLGTAYEVIGKNEMALSLIRKAVAINPNSHHGSEWIHVRILEQKVNPHPDYKRILQLDAEKDFAKWLSGENYDKDITPDSLMIEIAYQLHERIFFVEDPDPIVGQLVVDFADLVALEYSITEAKPFYKYAITYDPAFAVKERDRILIGEGEMAQEASEGATEEDVSITASRAKKPVPATSQWIIIAVVTVVVGCIALYFISRKKK